MSSQNVHKAGGPALQDVRTSLKGASPGGSTLASTTTVEMAPPGGTGRMDRETSSKSVLISLSLTGACLTIGWQVCGYAMKYHNHNKFPMPFTLLVFIAEAFKLAIFSVKLFFTRGTCASTSSISLMYLIPSTLYAANNNLTFLALLYTTPPIWNIFMQTRIIAIALVYKFYFHKPFTYIKWFALFLMTLSILILQFSGSDGIMSGAVSWNLLIALGIAVIVSIFAAVGPVVTEYLLKHDQRSFDDKQYQMYMFGSIVTGLVFLVERYTNTDTNHSIFQFTGDHNVLVTLIVIWMTSVVSSGIVVAYIIKKLDNIVKLYTQAVSSAMTAIACAFLFPLTFQFDFCFLISFVLTMIAIYLYEAKNPLCFNTRDNREEPTAAKC